MAFPILAAIPPLIGAGVSAYESMRDDPTQKTRDLMRQQQAEMKRERDRDIGGARISRIGSAISNRQQRAQNIATSRGRAFSPQSQQQVAALEADRAMIESDVAQQEAARRENLMMRELDLALQAEQLKQQAKEQKRQKVISPLTGGLAGGLDIASIPLYNNRGGFNPQMLDQDLDYDTFKRMYEAQMPRV